MSDWDIIRRARAKFIAMAVTYFLGVFNDNFFKQAVLLLAVAAGLSGLQGQATELFSLPFILFSAWGGWLADRFAKKHVVIGVKFLELVAMAIGAYGIVTLNWTCVLAMVFLMGLQSTLFGPALNGSIPELYPAEYVTTANSILKLVTTLAILLGMALAGFALDLHPVQTAVPFGQLLVAATVLVVALGGVLASFGVHYRPVTGGKVPFPWTGPLRSLRDLLEMRNDSLLLLAVCCDAFFYFISLLAVLVINTMGLNELGLSKSSTSLLSVALMVGVCLGAVVASRLTDDRRWSHVLAPGAAGMGLCMGGAGFMVFSDSGISFPTLLAILTGAGTFGGLFLIPVTSFIQLRPAADSKGRVIAAANFLGFSAMLFSGRLFTVMDRNLAPSVSMLVLGSVTLAVAAVIWCLLRNIRYNDNPVG